MDIWPQINETTGVTAETVEHYLR